MLAFLRIIQVSKQFVRDGTDLAVFHFLGLLHKSSRSLSFYYVKILGSSERILLLLKTIYVVGS